VYQMALEQTDSRRAQQVPGFRKDRPYDGPNESFRLIRVATAVSMGITGYQEIQQ